MSFRVLVIPEDPTNNGYILKPLTKALVADAGKPAAVVKVVDNPRLRGYGGAVHAIRHELADRYAMQDLWLFFPDADRAKPDAMRRLEEDRLSSNGCGWVEARSAGRRGVLAVHLTGGGRGAPWRDIVGAE